MRKLISIALAAVLAAGLLAGCAGRAKQTGLASAAESSVTSSADSASSLDSTLSSAISSLVSSSQAVSGTVSASDSVAPGNNYTGPAIVATSAATSPSAPAAVRSSVTPGTYDSSRIVVLTCATAGATIFYTTNGSQPSTRSAIYKSAVTVNKTTTIKAFSVKSGKASAISTFTFIISIPVKLVGDVVMRGSSALYPLMQLAVNPFTQKYGNLFGGKVDTGAGEGSGAGLDAVESGSSGCNIGNSDVTVAQAGKSYSDLVDHQVAVVAVAIVVNPDVAKAFGSNPIRMSDVLGIYNGTITNWTQVSGYKGGSQAIAVCYRKKGSGTRTLFQTYGIPGTLFDENKAPFNGNSFLYTNASADLANAVKNQAGAVGYETLPYCGDMNKLPVLFDLDARGNKLTNVTGSGVACSYANVYSGAYKIWGYEHMYTKGTPASNSSVKAFIDYITSADFQPTILSKGYGIATDLSAAAKTGH